jgi:hypothetical protein
MLSKVPQIFVGSVSKLERKVEELCRAMAASFEAAEMELPAWRKPQALLSRWMPAMPQDAPASSLVEHQPAPAAQQATPLLAELPVAAPLFADLPMAASSSHFHTTSLMPAAMVEKAPVCFCAAALAASDASDDGVDIWLAAPVHCAPLPYIEAEPTIDNLLMASSLIEHQPAAAAQQASPLIADLPGAGANPETFSGDAPAATTEEATPLCALIAEPALPNDQPEPESSDASESAPCPLASPASEPAPSAPSALDQIFALDELSWPDLPPSAAKPSKASLQPTLLVVHVLAGSSFSSSSSSSGGSSCGGSSGGGLKPALSFKAALLC